MISARRAREADLDKILFPESGRKSAISGAIYRPMSAHSSAMSRRQQRRTSAETAVVSIEGSLLLDTPLSAKGTAK
jgi:hypothetical protein